MDGFVYGTITTVFFPKFNVFSNCVQVVLTLRHSQMRHRKLQEAAEVISLEVHVYAIPGL